MQKDFMSMAQQAQEPMEDDSMSPLTDQDLIDSGLPTGTDEASVKERIMSLLGRFGVLEQASDSQKIKLEKEAAKLAKAIIAKDMEAMEANPLTEIFEKIQEDQQAQIGPSEEELAQFEMEDAAEQEPQQPQGPTNFAGMVPPGGGMLGR